MVVDFAAAAAVGDLDEAHQAAVAPVDWGLHREEGGVAAEVAAAAAVAAGPTQRGLVSDPCAGWYGRSL